MSTLTFDDLFPIASSEEILIRKEQYNEIYLKETIDMLPKTKLPDGTWHIHHFLDISGYMLSSLKKLNVSIVDKHFYCYSNNLTSLEGCPRIVKDYFSCACNVLTSLEGGPITVGRNFYCFNNPITSLNGCPKEVGNNFYCYDTLRKFTEAEVRSICNVKGQVFT